MLRQLQRLFWRSRIRGATFWIALNKRWRNRRTAVRAHWEQAGVECSPAAPARRNPDLLAVGRSAKIAFKPVSDVVGNSAAPPPRGRADDRVSDDRAAQLYAAIVQSSEQAIFSTDLSGVIFDLESRGATAFRLLGGRGDRQASDNHLSFQPGGRGDDNLRPHSSH